MAKTVLLENLTRDKIMIPTAVEDLGVRERLTAGHVLRDGLLILGDKTDTDDRTPPGGRDERMQPSPTRMLSGTDYEALGPLARKLIDDQVAQKRVRRSELAA